MCIVWSGGLLGDQLVASTNTGCLCQLKTQSSRLLHTINSAHTVDGLPIIVTRAVLKDARIPDISFCRKVSLQVHLPGAQTCSTHVCWLAARGFTVWVWLFLACLGTLWREWVLCDLSRVCCCPSHCPPPDTQWIREEYRLTDECCMLNDSCKQSGFRLINVISTFPCLHKKRKEKKSTPYPP